MKLWQIGLASLTLLVNCGAVASTEFDRDEEFLSLESEIESILEDQGIDEGDYNLDLTFEAEFPVKSASPALEKITPSSSPSKQITLKAPVKETPFAEESLGIQLDRSVVEEEAALTTLSPTFGLVQEEAAKSLQAIEVNFRQVFAGSPLIYLVLLGLSICSVCIWLYSMLTVRSKDFLPPSMIKEIRAKLMSNQYDEALDLCVKKNHFFCKMLASGILTRKYGLSAMIDSMKAEGKRSTISFWQRIGILSEIAVIAPMIGLLGTVMGMFYAFYDLNRSLESVSLLFDGLGISVGTTVGGLIVAILAMILHSTAKYRLVKVMASVENEVQTFAALIDTRTPNYLERG